MSRAIKYRPQTFDTLVAQDHIKTILKQQVLNRNNKANYLFFWPRWTGKTSTARILAKALNCTDLHGGNPCNQCVSCRLIDETRTLDFVEIDAASHTGVDNIREEIIEKALYHPTTLKKKIYIIDEVHMLSKGAFNALLKIMEEPPSYMTFILATTEIHKIPETIISRCQIFQFKKFSVTEIVERLQYIAQQENINAEVEALRLIAKLADGVMRDANKYLEQVSVLGDVSVEHVTNYLWIAGDQQLSDLLETIKSGQRENVLSIVDGLQQWWVELSQFAKQMLSYLNDHFLNDPGFYARMTALFSDIIMQIKYYPEPLLTYKTHIYQYLFDSGTNTKDGSTNTPVKPSNTALAWESKTENKITKADDQDSFQQEKKTDTEKTDLSVPVDVSDYEAIKAKLVSNVESKSLATMMEKNTIIKDISNDTLHLIVINKMAEISLNKDDVKQRLERILTELLARSIRLRLEYMKKEDYFASLM